VWSVGDVSEQSVVSEIVDHVTLDIDEFLESDHRIVK